MLTKVMEFMLIFQMNIYEEIAKIDARQYLPNALANSHHQINIKLDVYYNNHDVRIPALFWHSAT